jgi:hypothetical protein
MVRVEVTQTAVRVLMGNTGDCRSAAKVLRARLSETLSPVGSAGRRLAAGRQSSSVEWSRRMAAAHAVGSRRSGRKAQPSKQAQLSELTKQVVASIAVVGPVVMDAYCESLCRRSYHLDCVPSRAGRLCPLRGASPTSSPPHPFRCPALSCHCLPPDTHRPGPAAQQPQSHVRLVLSTCQGAPRPRGSRMRWRSARLLWSMPTSWACPPNGSRRCRTRRCRPRR